MKKERRPHRSLKIRIQECPIRRVMFLCFTVSALLAVGTTAAILYSRFSRQLNASAQAENQSMVERVERNLSNYFRDMMNLTDSCVYSVIKACDLETDSPQDQMTLLYNTYADYIDSMALFDARGRLVATAPAAIRRDQADIVDSDWFQAALEHPENVHFSRLRVQSVFENRSGAYRWVIPLSCAVELTRGKETETGVLLIHLKYSTLAEQCGVKLAEDGYVYLVDRDGSLVYHPAYELVAAGRRQESYERAASAPDGSYKETLEGQRRTVILGTTGYTGWRVVGVVPETALDMSGVRQGLVLTAIFSGFFLILTLVNYFLSRLLTDPIARLEASVNRVEREAAAEIYVGGTRETRQLGESVRKMVAEMRKLADDAAAEHEAKRKTELNALQAQINPHFLYNTLDIIVWMVENEQPREAVKLVTALARFFRISLSGGRNIIPVRDELEHVKNYLMIQEMRYKNKFHYEIQAQPETLELSTIKLMLQPIVENAIYHGMEYMEDSGTILVTAETRDGDLWIVVSDNGLGMTPEQAAKLLTGDPLRPETTRRKPGSGVGLKNVQSRIHLYFGEQYGLTIDSEPDEGTKVIIRLPAIPYGTMEES